MINTKRIVQVAAIDLLSLYALILKVAGKTLTIAVSTDVLGDYEIEEAPSTDAYIADQPVKTMDFATGVSAADVYFVADYEFAGFTVNGAAVTPTGDEIAADGRSLYLASLSGGAITITAQGV